MSGSLGIGLDSWCIRRWCGLLGPRVLISSPPAASTSSDWHCQVRTLCLIQGSRFRAGAVRRAELHHIWYVLVLQQCCGSFPDREVAFHLTSALGSHCLIASWMDGWMDGVHPNRGEIRAVGSFLGCGYICELFLSLPFTFSFFPFQLVWNPGMVFPHHWRTVAMFFFPVPTWRGWKAGAKTGGRWRPLGATLQCKWRCWESFHQMLQRHLRRGWQKRLRGEKTDKTSSH